MIKGKQAFYFRAADQLVRIRGERANTLGEFLEGIRRVSDSSIFIHTCQTVEKHHFLTEGFSNDFAHWALAALNEHRLAEQLEALDIRQFSTLSQMRQEVIRADGDRRALEEKARGGQRRRRYTDADYS